VDILSSQTTALLSTETVKSALWNLLDGPDTEAAAAESSKKSKEVTLPSGSKVTIYRKST